MSRSSRVSRPNRCTALLGSVALVLTGLGFASAAQAVPIVYTFSGSDAGGTGSAILTFESDDFGTNMLTVKVENTSPITVDDPLSDDANAPALLSFAFNLGDNVGLGNVTASSLVAQVDSGGGGTIDLLAPTDPLDPSSAPWELVDFTQGIQLDLIADNGNGVQEGLYNPDCLDDLTCSTGFAAGPQYFTLATLKLTFDQAVTPVFNDAGQGGVDASPLVRFQNVGQGGAGSLKLPGTPHTPVPEPSIVLLLGIGLVGLGIGRRRRWTAPR